MTNTLKMCDDFHLIGADFDMCIGGDYLISKEDRITQKQNNQIWNTFIYGYQKDYVEDTTWRGIEYRV